MGDSRTDSFGTEPRIPHRMAELRSRLGCGRPQAPGGEGKENFATILRLQKLGRSPWCCDMRAEAWRSEDGDRMEHC